MNTSGVLCFIGWDAARIAEFEPHQTSGLMPGRVARVDGRTVLLITPDGFCRAEPSAELQREAETAEALPAAGDWVGFSPRPQHDSDLIEVVLSRRTQLIRTRQVLKTAVERQVIAANLDFAFIVHAANNVNFRRLEREASLVASGGANVVIVLTKADLCDDIHAVLDEAKLSMPLVPAHAVSGATGEGVEALFRYARPDRTVAFIGASGVGKSTLTNRLLGREEMSTGAVREDDQRGRHTTTSRHLLPLDGGGALIDTPGMRSLGLSDASEGVAAVFDDVVELALLCRFTDCTHIREPGCAVQKAIASGELDEARLESFRKLKNEMEFIESRSNVRLRSARRDNLKERAKRVRKTLEAREKFGRPDKPE